MSAGFLFLNAGAVFAAGPYDGNWVIDFPDSGYNSASGQYRCPGIRLPIQISNNEVSGKLGRTGMGTELQSSNGQPVTGQVQPDGTLNLSWQNYSANGKLSSSQGEVMTARGSCGQRSGTAVRLQQ
jgi:hypothetical protein